MDAAELLGAVATTYANLKTLAVDLLITSESSDNGISNRSEQRAQAFFVAPDKLRIQHGSNVTVANGGELHHYVARSRRYSKNIVQDRTFLPGSFRPEFGIVDGTTFLFSRISERVAEAKILEPEPRGEPGRGGINEVVSVIYELLPSTFRSNSSRLTFWIDSRTRLVSRVSGETAYRLPAHEESSINKVTLLVTNASIDEPIPSEMFEFSPPPDTVDLSNPDSPGGCVTITHGRGGRRLDPVTDEQLENWHSLEQVGNTLMETSRLKFGSLNLAFERHLSFSEDRKEICVIERIITPAGQTLRQFSIPIA